MKKGKAKKMKLFRTTFIGIVLSCSVYHVNNIAQKLKFQLKGKKDEIEIDISGKYMQIKPDFGDKVKQLLSKIKDVKDIKSVFAS
jgi:hypothetical protein